MNRQVPLETYLIIGRGRLARHLCHYFDLKNIAYVQWSRVDSREELNRLVLRSQKILLALSDSAIEPFILENRLPVDKNIHFSGALSTPLAQQLHPLMTFGHDLYDLTTYERMAFVSPVGTSHLNDVLPELANAHYFIPQGNESLYHALCVLAGNGTSLLWQILFSEFQQRFHIPTHAIEPYLEQICENLKQNPSTALTGPWVRNDIGTIQKNRTALEPLNLDLLYKSLAQAAGIKTVTKPFSPQSTQNHSGVYL